MAPSRSPRNTEPQANGALARALGRRHPDWTNETVHAERTNVIEGSVFGTGTSEQPDILIAPPRRQPVIVETEFAPAHTVDQDATARLRKKLRSTGKDIEGALSVVLPENLKTGDLDTIESARFRYATHYLDSRGRSIRWPPNREWLEGGIDRCHAIFEDLKGRGFLPANEAYRDETRKALDYYLLFGVTSVLKLDPGLEEGLDLLRKQWCAEPSVHGGKGTQIKGLQSGTLF